MGVGGERVTGCMVFRFPVLDEGGGMVGIGRKFVPVYDTCLEHWDIMY